MGTDSVVLVEGPIRSLDGRYFDLTRGAEADYELITRLIGAARMLGARAINVHCIAPRSDPRCLTEEFRDQALSAALPFLRWFASSCARYRVRPLIENIPPVGRMREAALIYTPIGVEPQDLAWLTAKVDGLGITLDTSHAQLYINAASERCGLDANNAALQAIVAYYAERPHPLDLDDYVRRVGDNIVSAHVSNARGLLGEGLPYGKGDVCLDPIVCNLASQAEFLVTEPLEPDPNQSVLMRDCWQRIRSALTARYGTSE